MKKSLLIFIKIVDKLNTGCGWVARLAVFALIGVMLYEVVARYFMGTPTSWSNELGAVIFGFYFLIGGGYTLLKGGHVRMDILYANWRPRTRALVNALTFVLMAVYLVTFILGGWDTMEWAIKFKQRSMSQWAPLLWPIYLMTVVGAFLLLLQGVVMFIRDLYTAITGESLDEIEEEEAAAEAAV